VRPPHIDLASEALPCRPRKAAPLPLPPLDEQRCIVAEVDRRLTIVREIEAEVDANLKRAQALRQAVLARAFGGGLLSVQQASSQASCAA
jgi:type I restriction enzyme S subunit